MRKSKCLFAVSLALTLTAGILVGCGQKTSSNIPEETLLQTETGSTQEESNAKNSRDRNRNKSTGSS